MALIILFSTLIVIKLTFCLYQWIRTYIKEKR